MKRAAQAPLVLLFCLVLLGLGTAAVRAQETETGTETISAASFQYGQSATFELYVDSPEPVTGLSLFFGAPDFAQVYHERLPIEPQQTFSISYTISLAEPIRPEPFTTISYWWVLEQGQDEQLLVPVQVLEYNDDRFDWQALAAGDMRAHWTGADDRAAREALAVAARVRSHLDALLPVAQNKPLRIFIYPTTADLRSALRLTGLDLDENGQPPVLDAVLVTAVNPRTAAQDLARVLPRAMTYRRLRLVNGREAELPVWLREGIAAYVEAAVNGGYDDGRVRESFKAQETPPVSELCAAYPRGEQRSSLARAKSASLVHHLVDRFGEQALGQLVTAFASGADCDAAFATTFGADTNALESEWRIAQQPQSRFAAALAENAVWFLLLVVGFLLGGALLLPIRGNK